MDSKLEQAVQEIKSGNKAAGLVLLAQVIRSDPNNESAWIWMATAQDDPLKKKQCLERVLLINPGNERIRRALTVMYPPAVTTEQIPPASVAEPEPQPVVTEKPIVEPETDATVVPTQAVPPPPEPVEVIPPEIPQAQTAPLETQPTSDEPGPSQVAGPDLSWLKETTSDIQGAKEEAPDLSWLKEDLPTEEPDQAPSASLDTTPSVDNEPIWEKETLQPAEPDQTKEEPAPDLSWLKEDQSNEQAAETSFTWPSESEAESAPSDLSWLEETPAPATQKPETSIPPAPTGETDDLAWLRAASSGPAADISSAGKTTSTPSDEADLSWLGSEPAGEGKTGVEPFSEPVFPWLNEEAAPTEGQAVKNDDDSIPDWLRQGSNEEAEPVNPVSFETESPAQPPVDQKSPTYESEPLSPEDLDAITSKHAELPFTWDEVTGEPVLKTTTETPDVPSTTEAGAGPAFTADAGTSDMLTAQADQLTGSAPAGSTPPTPISRPRPAAAAPAAAREAAAAIPAQKKGMTRAQVVLLSVLGLAILIILLAFGFYLAVNLGFLKAFGF